MLADAAWVGLGGGVGAIARFAVGHLIAGRFGDFPFHTLLVNVTGSFTVGLLVALFADRFVVDPAWRLLLVVGFLGGYTTFSSYAIESLTLFESGRWLAAAGYILASNGIGLVAVVAGVGLTRVLAR